MSIKALSEYTFYSRYSQRNKEEKRRETWNEAVERLFDMHRIKYAKEIEENPKLAEYIDFAEDQQKKKRVLASQRSLQFASEPILKHELKMFNCFTQDTEFVTTHGVKSFSDFSDGDEIEVFGHSGQIRKAVVRNYGEDNFNEIRVNRGKSKDYVYKATKNHRWLLKDGSVTENLKIGDYIMSSVDRFSDFDFDSAEWDEKLYWCYGMVFGDGSITKVNGEPRGSLIRLCGYDKKYNNRFEEMGFKSSTPLSIGEDTFFYTGKYFKTAPDPEIDDPRLIRAFVRGYLDADGNKDNNCTKSNKFWGIVATGEEHYNFIRNCFPIAGVYIVSEKDITGEKTNKGIRGDARLFQIRNSFDRDNKFSQPFRVVSIEENVSYGDTWCLEVEEDKSFTLPNGMITGNCLFTHIDRERVFQEMMYSLLCGCGVGFSVQTQHIDQLGELKFPEGKEVEFVIPDSIEGWADAIGVLMASWSTKKWGDFDEYQGKKINFNFSKIRPEGELIAGRFKAPGPEGLRATLKKIDKLLNRQQSKSEHEFKLRPIDAYDIIMHISDAVLSGGVRRSATLCLFSKEDKEMLNAKTGNWFVDNPQRGRSNNSVALLRGHVSEEEFAEIMKSTRQFGEPGFIWTDDLESGYNPCVEINLFPKTKDGRSGFHACNLTEMNGKFCDSEEAFMEACKASAIIGTLQAGYTNLKYLRPESKEIFEEEALLGCSITGWMDNPDILFDPKLQRKGAKEVLKVNAEVADLIGIKTAARATCVKPAGSTSCVLGTASGIHPHHAVRYIRRTQVNRSEFCGQVFQKYNPQAVEPSVWSANGTDNVISFLCEVPAGAITKNQVGALDLLEKVKLTQRNWVEYGTRVERCINPKLRHNVSNTINVKDDEWEDVEKFIFKNQNYFAGISLLAASGDLDYAQAPFSTVLTPHELVREYGDASVLASGLIVDGLHAFDNDLWAACNVALGINKLPSCGKEPEYPKSRNYKELAQYFADREAYEKCELKQDWVRRVKQFAMRYFEYEWSEVSTLQSRIKSHQSNINYWKYALKMRGEYDDDNVDVYDIDPEDEEKPIDEIFMIISEHEDVIKEHTDRIAMLDLKLKKATYCLKHVSLWKTWCDLKREYRDIDWKAEQEEIEEFQNADELGAQACAGGSCDVNF